MKESIEIKTTPFPSIGWCVFAIHAIGFMSHGTNMRRHLPIPKGMILLKQLVILLFLIVCNTMVAQDTTSPVEDNMLHELIQKIPVKSVTIHYNAPPDTSQVTLRLPSASVLNKFRKDSDFNYSQDTEYGKTIWDMIRYYFNKFYRQLYDIDGSGKLLRWLWIALLVGVAVFGLTKMLGVDVSGIFFKKPEPIIDLSDTVIDENVAKDKLSAMLEKALAEKQYRLAVRLTYLIVLRRLSDTGQIHWQTDKTNRSYLNEIHDQSLRQSFANLTRSYEYVWYGDFDINAGHYRDIENDFNELNRRLR